jgi:transcription termination factor Rho
MAVLDRSELEASPLADLHAIADQLGLDGFRRLRKADLIDAILGEPANGRDGAGAAGHDPDSREDSEGSGRLNADEEAGAGSSARARGGSTSTGAARKRRAPRLRRGAGSKGEAEGTSADERESSSASRSSASSSSSSSSSDASDSSRRGRGAGERDGRSGRGGRGAAPSDGRAGAPSSKAKIDGDEDGARSAEGVVELLGNGSAFLRVDPPEPSDDDVYISAAQVRRCELVSGDRVTGPVRTPRRSERYPSLVRIDTINGASADAVSESAHYEDLPVAYPSQRFALNAGDPTLDAIEWLTPLGRGSRAVIVGPARAGKTETLRRLLGVLAGSDAVDRGSETAATDTGPADWPGALAPQGEAAGEAAPAGKAGSLEVTVVLAGARPEEIAEWREGQEGQDGGLPIPVAALSFAASADAQGQAVERAIEAAKRVAARGGDAVVLIDGLDGMHPPAARKTLAAARNLRDGGSLTVIATATRPFGGETTVIALDAGLTGSGLPILDLAASGTLKAELLVGEGGAKAIAKARAEARG